MTRRDAFRATGSVLLVGVLWLTEAGAAESQVQASEAATMSQTIDGTVLTMTYSRPSRRGRDPIFGAAVPWHRWTPGANWATTLEVTKDVKLDGHALPMGKYSVWIDISEARPWQLVLDPDARRFHMDPPKDNDAQIRFPVTPVDGPELETLLWHVDKIRGDRAELVLHWGTTVVAMALEVPSSQRLTATPEEAAAVVGSWEGSYSGPAGSDGEAFKLEVRYDPATSRIVADMGMAVLEGGDGETYLFPVSDGVFAMGWGVGGEVWEIFPGFIEFSGGDDGSVGSFEARDAETDEVWMRGRRTGGGLDRPR